MVKFLAFLFFIFSAFLMSPIPALAQSTNDNCPIVEITSIPQITDSKWISPTSFFISWQSDESLRNFIVLYGLQDGSFQYSTKISGFSTTINDLPVNQPFLVKVAATNNCTIGPFGKAVIVGEKISPDFPNTGLQITRVPKTTNPLLPNTGISPNKRILPWYTPVSIFNFLRNFWQ